MGGRRKRLRGARRRTASGRTRAAKLFRKRRLIAPRRGTLVAPFRSGRRHADHGRKDCPGPCLVRQDEGALQGLKKYLGSVLLTFGLVMCDRGFSASRVRRRHWLAA